MYYIRKRYTSTQKIYTQYSVVYYICLKILQNSGGEAVDMGEERDFTIEDQLIRILSSNADEEECPIQRALELLGGKWRTHIIYELCIKPAVLVN